MLRLPFTRTIRGSLGSTALATSIAALIAAHLARGVNYWFDQNGTTAGFGVADGSSYDWTDGTVWGASNAGTGALIAWPGGSNGAFLTGAGDTTNYTVRLGAAGASNVVLQNFFLNSNGAATAAANGLGNVTIGNVGDTGELQLNAANSFGSAAGTLTINNPFNLGANRNGNYRGGSVTIDGVISGTGTSGVTLVSGGSFTGALAAGTLTLANPNNTYTGATAINANYVLSVSNLADGGLSSSIGASSNAATNLALRGGTLRYTGGTVSTDRNFTLLDATVSSIDVSTSGTTLTLTGASTATTGGLTKLGDGTLVLAGASLYSGVTKVSAGILELGHNLALQNSLLDTSGAGNLAVSAGITTPTLGGLTSAANLSLPASVTSVTLNLATGVTATYSGALGSITPGLAVTKTGAGTQVLSGANGYTGSTTLTAGTLSISDDANLGSGGNSLIFDGGTLQVTGTTLTSYDAGMIGTHPVTLTPGKTVGFDIANSFTIGQSLNQTTGGLSKSGAGTLTLTSASTYTGPTTVSAGTLNLTGSLTGSSVTTSGTGIVTQGAGGVIAGDGTTFTQGSSGTTILSGANTYTGATTLTAGTLSVGADANLGSANPLILNGGTLQITGTALGSYASGAIGTHPVTLTPGPTVHFDINNAAHTFTISEGLNQTSGGLTKSGAGTLVLAGTNTYTGATTVSNGGGALRIDAATALPVASAIILPRAGLGTGSIHFNLTGTQAINNPFTFSSANSYANGGAATVRNLQGDLTLGGNMTITNGGGNGAIIQSDAGLLTLSGTLANNVNASTRPFSLGGAGNGVVSGPVNNGAAGRLTSITKSGTGTWSLTGANNSFTGGVLLLEGILNVASLSDSGVNSAIGAGGEINFTGQGSSGTLQYTGPTDQATNRPVNIAATGGTLDSSGAGSVAFTGTFTSTNVALNLVFANGSDVITNNSSISPGVVVGMTLPPVAGLPAGTTITAVNGNRYTLSNTFTGTTGGMVITFEGAPERVLRLTGSNMGNNEVSGSLSDAGLVGKLGITKAGPGRWSLTGANSYTGATAVEAGTVLVHGSITGSAVTVNNTGILGGGILGVPGLITGSVTVNAGGTLAPGAGIGTLQTGDLSLGSGATFSLEISSSAASSDLAAINGNFSLADADNVVLAISDLAAATLTSGALTFITYSGAWDGDLFSYQGNVVPDGGFLTVGANSFQLDYNFGNSVALIAVPEPGRTASLLAGIGLLLGLRRRRA